jgi:hypothetical protein
MKRVTYIRKIVGILVILNQLPLDRVENDIQSDNKKTNPLIREVRT